MSDTPTSTAPLCLLNSQGNRLVAGLFVEFSFMKNDTPPSYTLSKQDRIVDGVVYPSLYRLYMEEGDVTEVNFVSKYLHDMKQWDLICNNKHIADEIAEWQKELRLLKLAEAIQILEEDAASDSRSSKSSAKFLVERVYGLPSRAGRPSKSKNDRADDKLSGSQISSDFERLFGNATAK